MRNRKEGCYEENTYIHSGEIGRVYIWNSDIKECDKTT